MIFDFRLKVFYSVAQNLSFTKAGNELFITQPAVTKQINELEHQLQTRLFNRHGNSISITPAGQILFRYAEQIFRLYGQLENELAQLADVTQGNLNIGASTTLATYVLPRILALFKKRHPDIQIRFINGNSDFIEQQIITEKLDIALVEGVSNHPQIHYDPFVKDEIVLVARSNAPFVTAKEMKPEQLLKIPLVIREQGSGTLEVVQRALAEVNIKAKDLVIDIKLESTESIKQYLLYADSAAFLSIHAVTKELRKNDFTIIDIKGVDISRTFQFIQLQGQHQKLADLFQRFCKSHYNFL